MDGHIMHTCMSTYMDTQTIIHTASAYAICVCLHAQPLIHHTHTHTHTHGTQVLEPALLRVKNLKLDTKQDFFLVCDHFDILHHRFWVCGENLGTYT